MVTFSIVVPVFNGDDYVEACLLSALEQEPGDYSSEIIAVDDCSTDATPSILARVSERYPEQVRVLRTVRNGGPGIARNVALREAIGDWILFLDSDDRLCADALVRLAECVCGHGSPTLDIVAFDWRYDASSEVSAGRAGGRYDFGSLAKEKDELVKESVSLGMDGSVIYTLMRREMLEQHGTTFHQGVHEDVDFIFKVYWCTREIGIVDHPLYLKNNRRRSIVNSISRAHIDGYFRAYGEILRFIKSRDALTPELARSYVVGVVGIVATRTREIWAQKLSADESLALYDALYANWLRALDSMPDTPVPRLKTKYGIIAERFFGAMQAYRETGVSPVPHIVAFMGDVIDKSWSCYDLHNSVFLAPEEIRTCCKRFFVDGEMKGDVVIVRRPDDQPAEFSAQAILRGKKELYGRINRGQAAECDGCPFLEFKNWGYIEELAIEHLSLEYHTVCNLRCAYCDELYYGGGTAEYDVAGLVEELVSKGALANCRSVVWGGGEPVLDPTFVPLVEMIAERFPRVKQRVLSNAVKYSETIDDLLRKDRIMLLSSIDAGTKSTFEKVRGRERFADVLRNLSTYAKTAAENVCIKYIFTEDNRAEAEVRAFVERAREHGLLGCSFQISSDFKQEAVGAGTIVSAILRHALLSRSGARLVYLDELLRERMAERVSDSWDAIWAGVERLGVSDALADSTRYPRIVLWGAGRQTELLLKTSRFFSQAEVAFIVDSTPSKIGGRYLGREVRPPASLTESQLPVLISAVQSSPIILQKYLAMGLPESRLVRGLVI